MKHVVLSLAAVFAVLTSGLAQVCEADFVFPDGVTFGLSPDPLIGETFEDGYLGELYADTLHILVPTSADDLVGIPVPVDSVVVQNISLIGESGEALLISEVGLELTPNNNGDSGNPYTFLGGEQYCATLTGTPDTTGFFFASINVVGWANFLGSPISQEVPFEGYSLTLILEGCTDPMACNYDSLATEDDGSCAEFDALEVCGGDCFAADSTGCIELIMLGCTDSLACNYEMDANTDDGSCLVIGESCDDMDDMTVNDMVTADCGCAGEAIVEGCTNSEACNYEDMANVDDGSCLLIGEACDDMDDMTVNDVITADCACAGEAIIEGCTNEAACNYDMDANVDDGTCLVIGESCDDMDDMTVNDIVTDDCACVGEAIVEGCTNADACNYDMDANTDDGSCLVIGEACDDNDDSTINDVVTENCECAGEVDAVLEVDFELNVYPNPTMGEVIITLPVGHAFDLTLVSLSGQTVQTSQTTKGGPVVWNVEGLPAGAYLLHVRNEHATAVRRVLVGGR